MKRLLTIAALALTLVAQAADGPYNETADARAEIAQALKAADADHVPVLVVFGANWCPDCKVLDLSLKQGPSAPLVAQAFKVVKVDVGRFDRNVDIADGYGVPLKKGIPSVAILTPQGQVTYVTRGGELADARRLGDSGIYDFFKRVAPGIDKKS